MCQVSQDCPWTPGVDCPQGCERQWDIEKMIEKESEDDESNRESY